MEENNVKLREATSEEKELLKSWADKNCRKTRKEVIVIFALPVSSAYAFLLIVNAIYIHSWIIVAAVIFLCIFLLLFCSALYFVLAPSLSKKIASGAYKVQSGRITDRNEENNSKDSKTCNVVFETEDGDRTYISINPSLYSTVKTGPCLILKWDDSKENHYFRVIMSD